MRARLHRPAGDDSTAALHLDPVELVSDPPPYPHPDETADRLRKAGEYSTNRHHDQHTAAVREWRQAVRESVVDAVDLPTDSGPHRVDITHLG